MFILIWRLYVVQIKGGDEHRESIRSQSIRRIRIPSVRGRIISSDGQYFADNRVKYDTYIHIHELRKRTKAGTIEYVLEKIQELADLIGRDHTFTKETPLNKRILRLKHTTFSNPALALPNHEVQVCLHARRNWMCTRIDERICAQDMYSNR